jgi:hypothetical protein
MCIASAGFTVSNVVSGGGIAALAVRIFRHRQGSAEIDRKKDSRRRTDYVDSGNEARIAEGGFTRRVVGGAKEIFGQRKGVHSPA